LSFECCPVKVVTHYQEPNYEPLPEEIFHHVGYDDSAMQVYGCNNPCVYMNDYTDREYCFADGEQDFKCDDRGEYYSKTPITDPVPPTESPSMMPGTGGSELPSMLPGTGGSQPPSMMPGTDGSGSPVIGTEKPSMLPGTEQGTLVLNMTTASGCKCGMKKAGTEKKIPKIVGGTNTEVNEWPWMAAISFSTWGAGQAYGCGATLINNKFLISAAHCFFKDDGSKIDPRDITIVLMDHDKSVDTETQKLVYTVHFILTHLDYDPITFKNDIAIIKINSLLDNTDITEVDLNKVTPACLPTKGGYTGSAWVYGWGTLKSDGDQPNILQEVALDLASKSDCSTAMQSVGTEIVDGMLCAGGDEGKDSCQGDSGGPLTVDNNGQQELIGAVSFGIGCAQGGLYGVYADIYYYLDWINAVVAGEGPSEFCPL